jgi:hypothetical protein
MRNPFEALVEPLDPEEQQMVDEVCGALAEAGDDPWAERPASALKVGWAWLVALRKSGSHECRQRIFDLVDQRVRADRTLFVGANGYIYPWSQINEHGGTTGYEPDPETGELRRVLRFPAGPDERRRAA